MQKKRRENAKRQKTENGQCEKVDMEYNHWPTWESIGMTAN